MAAGTRNLIGPLTIELSTEVNCLRDLLTIFNPTAMAKEQVCRGKRVAQRYSRRSRRIVIISFSPENGVRFDASCLSLGAEKYSNSEVCIPFYHRQPKQRLRAAHKLDCFFHAMHNNDIGNI